MGYARRKCGRIPSRTILTLSRHPLSQIDPNRFGLCIGIQDGMAHLATVAALFVATERCGCVELVVGVDPDNAGFEQSSHLVGFLEVARPDTGRQAVDRFVGTSGHFLYILEWQGYYDGTKNLLTGNGHVVVNIVEHCGLHKV